MLRIEDSIRDKIAELLIQEGHSVQKEVRVSRGYRVDILAVKEDIVRAIEVKATPRGIMNDISKAYRLLRLPEPVEVYVAAPADLIGPDHIAFATQNGVGVLALAGPRLEWQVSSWRLEPPRLLGSSSFPGGAQVVGKIFEVRRGVRNDGQKVAKNLYAYVVPAGPFSYVPGGIRTHRKAFLDPGEEWSVSFMIKVSKSARPGRYPLSTVVTVENAERSDMTFEVLIVSGTEKNAP